MYLALFLFLYILSCLFYTAIYFGLLIYKSSKGDKANQESVESTFILWIPVLGTLLLALCIPYAFLDKPITQFIADKINEFAQGDE